MYANSIHVVDYLRVFGRGKITSVTPVFAWDPKTSHVVVAKIEFDSGDIGLYEGVWKGPGPWGPRRMFTASTSKSAPSWRAGALMATSSW